MSNRHHSKGLTTLRRTGSPNNPVLMLTISAGISRGLMAAGLEGQLFRAELTDEGILFRPAEDKPVEIPKWAKR